METVEKLKKHIEVLEQLLKGEKKFRDSINKILTWENQRNEIECDGLRRLVCKKMIQVRELSEDLEETQDELFNLRTQCEEEELTGIND